MTSREGLPAGGHERSREALADAAARAHPSLMAALVAASGEIFEGLARLEAMVPWDREQLVGQLQRLVRALSDVSFDPTSPPVVRVEERRDQPLEILPVAWSWLRRGSRVRLACEVDGTSAWIPPLLREVLGASGAGCVEVLGPEDAASDDGDSAPVVGVERAPPRAVVIAPGADEELAAYVLARACLRRAGLDPRSARLAVCVAGTPALDRHLRRLWYGVRLGAAEDDGAFAGSVDDVVGARHLRALEALPEALGARCVVPARALQGEGRPGRVYLAPSLWVADVGQAEGWLGRFAAFPRRGPAMLLARCPDVRTAEALLDGWIDAGGDWLRVGGPVRARAEPFRIFEGALLEDRLPPGMPKPRP